METKAFTLMDESSGAKVKVSLFGATIISWIAGGKERLWLSDKAVLDGSKAIRGGIPPVFPVFGKSSSGPCAELPQHGFARNTLWSIKTRETHTAALVLTPQDLSSEFASAWPFAFQLIYTITLSGPSLTTRLEIRNNDSKDFAFQTLLHTYFRVSNIHHVHVEGLHGLTYKDKVTASEIKEDAEKIRCTSETDRVYPNVNHAVSIHENDQEIISITRQALDDIVLWNPWTNCTKMSDFAPSSGYENMICVEAGAVSQWHTLSPGKHYVAQQVLTARL